LPRRRVDGRLREAHHPHAIQERNVSVYIFNDYWEDIGTIRAFYEANLDLTDVLPKYSFFDASAPIYTHPRFLPAARSMARRCGRRSSPMAASSPTRISNGQSSASGV
jgi:ADP-glucose pyrophosphorylase